MPAPAVYAVPAPVVEYIAPAPAVPFMEYIAPAPAVPVVEYICAGEYIAPAPGVPVGEYIAPAPGVPVGEYIAPVPAVPVVEYIAPAPGAPVVEYIAPAPAVFAVPAPVVENIAPAPGVANLRQNPLRGAMPSGMRHRPSVAEKCDTRASRVVAARLGYMWRKSKQVERAACDRLLADMGTVLQYRDELSEIGPVLTRLAGRGDGVVLPSVQHFALQQQLASLTAMMADHEDAILELERQVASLEPGVQSLDTKVRELGMLLSKSMSVVEGRVNVMDEDLKEFLERRTAETSLAVAELGEKLEMKRREVSDLTSFVVDDIQVAGRVHEDLKVKVLHVDQQVMNLVEWSTGITTTLNDVESRVDNLEQWGEELAESL